MNRMGLMGCVLLALAGSAEAAPEEIEGTLEIRWQEIRRADYRDGDVQITKLPGYDLTKSVGLRHQRKRDTKSYDCVEAAFLWIRSGKQSWALDCAQEPQRVLRLVSKRRAGDTVVLEGRFNKQRKFEVQAVLSHARKTLSGSLTVTSTGLTIATGKGPVPLAAGTLSTLLRTGANQTVRVRGLATVELDGRVKALAVTAVEAKTTGLAALRERPSSATLGIKGVIGSDRSVWVAERHQRGYYRVDSSWIDATKIALKSSPSVQAFDLISLTNSYPLKQHQETVQVRGDGKVELATQTSPAHSPVTQTLVKGRLTPSEMKRLSAALLVGRPQGAPASGTTPRKSGDSFHLQVKAPGSASRDLRGEIGSYGVHTLKTAKPVVDVLDEVRARLKAKPSTPRGKKGAAKNLKLLGG